MPSKNIAARKLPEYLIGIKAPREFRSIHEKWMTNWMLLHGHLQMLEGELEEVDYYRLMVMELDRDEPRIDILWRLRGKANHFRKVREYNELVGLVEQ